MSRAKGQHWDVIVIGTGMGGGTIGRRLAEAGKRVLFVEKGPAGHRAEQTALNPAMEDPTARQIRGFWPAPMRAKINGRENRFFAPLGAGVGGSSVFYAATLERPEPHDLDDTPERPHPTGGWPIQYSELAPYLDEAERIYHVAGTDDPLSATKSTLAAPPASSSTDEAIAERLRARSMHPYHLHSAIRQLEGCHDCLGFKCPRSCKMDARSAGVEPALESGNAELMSGSEATKIIEKNGGIVGVDVRSGATTSRLTADQYILAGGALGSPRLLMASGLCCANDLVGRNLMFHFNEMFAIWPGRAVSGHGPSKSVGLRDLYHVSGKRLGMVQAMGIDAGYGEIAWYLKSMVERSALGRFRLARELTRIPAAIAAKLMGNAKIFVGLMEDLPFAHNRVLPPVGGSDVIEIEYTIADEALSRRKLFRRLIKRAFRGQHPVFLSPQPELNFGHPCGTLKMGQDAAASVLDPDCRAHGLRNLYVVDASFMPTSMGVNPSLTIVANALRVGDIILSKMEAKNAPK